MPHKTPHNPTRRRGFTLVELLASISIIALLVGLTVMAYALIVGGAQTTATRATVRALGQGVESFKLDFNGKIPPLVTRAPASSSGPASGAQRAMQVPGTRDNAADRAQEARDAGYFSEWTLAVYLLGEGDLNGDGTTTYTTPGNPQPNLDDGLDGPGFRDPGNFLAWKRVDDSGNIVHEPATSGRTYGPYLEPGASDYLETVIVDGARMSRFVDAWGNPIRYYAGYQTEDPNTGAKSSLFMPQELRTEQSMRQLLSRYASGLPTGADLQTFTSLDQAVLNAEYVILAANDDPANHIDIDGRPVVPFGDVLLDGDGARVPLTLPGDFISGTGPSAFDTTIITGNVDVGDSYTDMITSNVRYTP